MGMQLRFEVRRRREKIGLIVRLRNAQTLVNAMPLRQPPCNVMEPVYVEARIPDG